jgi:predicted transcriptional regulator
VTQGADSTWRLGAGQAVVRVRLSSRAHTSYCKDMIDLKFQAPVTEEVEVDTGTLAAIDRGLKDATEGRTVPLDEVRKMIPQWIAKFGSVKPR